MLPKRFLKLAKRLLRESEEDIQMLKKYLKVRSHAKAYDIAIWSEILDIPPSFAIEALGLPEACDSSINRAQKRLKELPKEMLRDVKSNIWRRWGEIVREEVTTLREIVNPILAYSESLKKTEGRKKGEIFGQGQIEMINAFFKARKVSIETGLRELKECIAQIPIYLLFWLPRPLSIRTFFETIRK